VQNRGIFEPIPLVGPTMEACFCRETQAKRRHGAMVSGRDSEASHDVAPPHIGMSASALSVTVAVDKVVDDASRMALSHRMSSSRPESSIRRRRTTVAGNSVSTRLDPILASLAGL